MLGREVRATARSLLPGVRLSRHLMGRYSLLWSKTSEALKRLPAVIRSRMKSPSSASGGRGTGLPWG